MLYDLSVNNIDRQIDLAQGDDGSGQVIECKKSVFEFLVAHQQLAESIEPSMASLHHPAARLLLRIAFLALCLALAAHYMRDVVVGQDDLQGGFTSVARICTQLLAAPLSRRGALDQARRQHSLKLHHIVCVGSRHDEGQRDATPVHQQVELAALFPPDPSDCAPPPLVPTAL